MSGSILDQLREARRQAASQTTTDLPVPGYRGAVVARYRVVDPLGEGREIGERVRNQFSDPQEREYYGLVDILIAACEGIYLRNEVGELEPIDPDGDGVARYDARLARALGVEAGTAREVVEALFNDRRVSITTHGVQLTQWMADPTGPLGEG